MPGRQVVAGPDQLAGQRPFNPHLLVLDIHLNEAFKPVHVGFGKLDIRFREEGGVGRNTIYGTGTLIDVMFSNSPLGMYGRYSMNISQNPPHGADQVVLCCFYYSQPQGIRPNLHPRWIR